METTFWKWKNLESVGVFIDNARFCNVLINTCLGYDQLKISKEIHNKELFKEQT